MDSFIPVAPSRLGELGGGINDRYGLSYDMLCFMAIVSQTTSLISDASMMINDRSSKYVWKGDTVMSTVRQHQRELKIECAVYQGNNSIYSAINAPISRTSILYIYTVPSSFRRPLSTLVR